MMASLSLIIGAVLGVALLGLIIFILLKYPCLPLIERLGLGLLAAGLIWGGVDRIREAAFGGGDLIMLTGLLITLWRFGVCHPKIGVMK